MEKTGLSPNPEFRKGNFRIRSIFSSRPDYPRRLRSLPDMPERFYVRGSLPRDDLPSIALVGERTCSSYGRKEALRFSQVLSESGVQVMSTMDYGIAAWSQRGALWGGTPSFGVLESGSELGSPVRNRPLFMEVLSNGGGMICEFSPRSQGRNRRYASRNRLLAGLCDLVLLVEARGKGEALEIVNLALEQGKPVYAIPGPVEAELSRICHQLIYDGAGIAYSPEVLLEEWGISKRMRGENGKK